MVKSIYARAMEEIERQRAEEESEWIYYGDIGWEGIPEFARIHIRKDVIEGE